MLTYTLLSETSAKLDNGKKSVVVYPNDAKVQATVSLHSTPEQEESSKEQISWPGEYDIDGIAVRGIGHDDGDRVSYTVELDGVRSAFLSEPLHDWTDHEIELLGDTDVLVIPCDNASTVQKIIDEVDPRVVIPLKTKSADAFQEVLKAIGAGDQSAEKEFKVKGSLPAEGRQVVVLK